MDYSPKFPTYLGKHIRDVLREAGRPMARLELADAVHARYPKATLDDITQRLIKLIARGEVARIGRGMYEITTVVRLERFAGASERKGL